MDLVANYKEKLAHFKVKELKDVLTQLGLSKQGKKQDLIDRILAILSDDQVSGARAKKNTVGKDEVAKLVDDTYKKIKNSGATDLASKSQGFSDSTILKPKEEVVDSCRVDNIRCICGNSLATESMIKCEDRRCNVWQHRECVVIPEKPMEGVLPSPPEIFFCEICRLNRADPFWVSMAHPLYPVKLNIANVPADGSNPGLSIEKVFKLTRTDKELMLKQEFDVQGWCMLLNDKVTFRMQWPLHAEMLVNGVLVKTINRPGNQLLGANGRDEGPLIKTYTRDGINKISLTGCDARIFCVGVRLVRQRKLEQILSMIPKEDRGERFEDALARVRKCVGGGAAAENADSNSDIEVVADYVHVNLRCPMSGLRIKIAGRFKPCAHMGCFDLEVFLEMTKRSRKWQCPICLKNYSWEKIIIDPYFNRITSKMKDVGEDVADIEVKPDGSWRAKAEGGRKDLGELGLWHFPDGIICPSTEAESKAKAELEPVKQDNGSDAHGSLKIGIRRNQNGCWEVNNKADNVQVVSPANRFQQNFSNSGRNIFPMSSSATSSGRDEDGSVNENGGRKLDFSPVNGIEYESIETPRGFNDPFTAAPAGDTDVIVLSDSDEEIEPLMSAKPVLESTGADTSGFLFPASQRGIPDSYYENPAVGNNANSCVDPYSTNDDELVSDLWSMPSGGHGVSNFQLFGPDAGISDPLVDMQHDTLNCQSLNGYTVAAETSLGSAALVPVSDAQQSNTNNGLDSLQIFLPSRPSDASITQTDLRDCPDVSNGIGTEDWISLRLGDGGQAEPAAGNSFGSGNRSQSKESRNLDSLAGHASFLLGVNCRTGKTSREIADSPFSFPRQPRSVRPRLDLSIDSESE